MKSILFQPAINEPSRCKLFVNGSYQTADHSNFMPVISMSMRVSGFGASLALKPGPANLKYIKYVHTCTHDNA